MKQNNFKQILLLAFLIAVILGGISYATRTSDQPEVVTESVTAEVESLSVQLFIDGLYKDEVIAIESGETVLTMLEKLNSENTELQLATKDFGEMGVLVDAMGGQVNSTDNHYWQYEVNGEAPMIGADQYELKGGDSVVWEFKASEF